MLIFSVLAITNFYLEACFQLGAQSVAKRPERSITARINSSWANGKINAWSVAKSITGYGELALPVNKL
jgi:hypothetical protein